MDTESLTHLGFGLVLVIAAAITLLLLVQQELAPDGGLSGRGRWLLAAGLGSGVLAFLVKLLALGLFSALPEGSLQAFASITPRPFSLHLAPAPEERLTPLLAPRTDYVWQTLPAAVPGEAQGPRAAALIALGETLFRDTRLSRDGRVACASCHDLYAKAGADGRATSVGIAGQRGSRNAPTVWNAAYQSVLFWDGRAASLEAQAAGPFVNPVEMGMPDLDAVVARVRAASADYTAPVRAAFDLPLADIRAEHLLRAIAAFERTLVTRDTPYDRFVEGDPRALDAAQLRGMALFQETGCVNCHNGPNFSGASTLAGDAPFRIFPANPSPLTRRYGLAQDKGRAAVDASAGVWRVPSLRNVALTGPYFHNGAVTDLAEAVRIMASAQLARPLAAAPRGEDLKVVWSEETRTLGSVHSRPLQEQEVADLVAFLHALSSDRLVAAQHGRKAATHLADNTAARR